MKTPLKKIFCYVIIMQVNVWRELSTLNKGCIANSCWGKGVLSMNVKDVEMDFYTNDGAASLSLVPVKENTRKLAIIKELRKICKRSIDIAGGVVGVLILIPLTIAIFCVNFFSKENGPLFYSQERIGKNGKHFKMYKFRTMVVGADEKLERMLEEDEEARREYKKYKKLKYDPRITKVGNFLRRTSLDEFPQFINVLKGEMSLVGPRPYLPKEKDEMGDYYTFIVRCKPGVTGYWQTNGRSDVTFDDRLKMDFDYYNQKSTRLDLELLSKTVANVIKKEGAA